MTMRNAAVIAAIAAVAGIGVVASSGSAGTTGIGTGRLAFSMTDPNDGMPDIYAMNADGTRQVNLTHDKGIRTDMSPSWASNGTKAVFVRRLSNVVSSVMLVNADGSKLRNLTPVLATDRQLNVDPSWSPKDNMVVFASNRDGNFDLYVVKPGGTPIRLTNTKAPVQNLDPSWSPNGRYIVFSRTERSTITPGAAELYLLKLGTTKVVQLTKTTVGLGDRGATWSPNSSSIAFYSDRKGNDNVYVYFMATGRIQALTTSLAADREPTWAPDGTGLVFISTSSGAAELWALNLIRMTSGPPQPVQLTFDKQNKSHPSWTLVPTVN